MPEIVGELHVEILRFPVVDRLAGGEEPLLPPAQRDEHALHRDAPQRSHSLRAHLACGLRRIAIAQDEQTLLPIVVDDLQHELDVDLGRRALYHIRRDDLVLAAEVAAEQAQPVHVAAELEAGAAVVRLVEVVLEDGRHGRLVLLLHQVEPGLVHRLQAVAVLLHARAGAERAVERQPARAARVQVVPHQRPEEVLAEQEVVVAQFAAARHERVDADVLQTLESPARREDARREVVRSDLLQSLQMDKVETE